MKVIKESKAKAWTMRVKCTGAGNGGGGCKSLLEIQKTDIFGTDNWCRDDHDTFLTIECPVCKAWTDLDKSKVPSQVIDPNMPRRSPENRTRRTETSDK